MKNKWRKKEKKKSKKKKKAVDYKDGHYWYTGMMIDNVADYHISDDVNNLEFYSQSTITVTYDDVKIIIMMMTLIINL